LTTAKVTTEVVARPGSSPSWWAVAGALLALGLAAVLGYTVIQTSGGRLSDPPAPLFVDGGDMLPTQGTGRKDGKAFVLEAPGADGAAVLAAKLSPFQARDFSRVEWKLATAQAPSELVFVWRTREHPRRSYGKRLRWLVSGAAPLELTAEEGWSGTITGVALLIGSGMTAPVRVESLRIVARSAFGSAETLVSQWTEPNPLRGYSVNFPFDAERGHDLPALPAVAIAEALAMGLYLLLARRNGWPRDRRVLWAIFLGGWLLLDLRWQSNLWREVAERGQRFAGKTTEEMHRVADDAPLYAIVDKIRSALPAAATRVLVYCDNDFLCVRAGFLLYPQNVYRAVKPRRPLPSPGNLRPGDHVLLLYSRAMGYDRGRALLVWPDGGTRSADEVLALPEALLLRIR